MLFLFVCLFVFPTKKLIRGNSYFGSEEGSRKMNKHSFSVQKNNFEVRSDSEPFGTPSQECHFCYRGVISCKTKVEQ